MPKFTIVSMQERMVFWLLTLLSGGRGWIFCTTFNGPRRGQQQIDVPAFNSKPARPAARPSLPLFPSPKPMILHSPLMEQYVSILPQPCGCKKSYNSHWSDGPSLLTRPEGPITFLNPKSIGVPLHVFLSSSRRLGRLRQVCNPSEIISSRPK